MKASVNDVDTYTRRLKKDLQLDESSLNQKREDKANEVKKVNLLKRKTNQVAKEKTMRTFISQSEYESFLKGLEAAITDGLSPESPYTQLVKYLPEKSNAALFPPNSVWKRDFCRVLFGLEGEEGEDMRKADLSVYDGVPFSELSGRNKIAAAKEKVKKKDTFNQYSVIANYWRTKIMNDTRQTRKGQWVQLKFVFNKDDQTYYKSKLCSL